jgi:hypothetical protein
MCRAPTLSRSETKKKKHIDTRECQISQRRRQHWFIDSDFFKNSRENTPRSSLWSARSSSFSPRTKKILDGFVKRLLSLVEIFANVLDVVDGLGRLRLGEQRSELGIKLRRIGANVAPRTTQLAHQTASMKITKLAQRHGGEVRGDARRILFVSEHSRAEHSRRRGVRCSSIAS